MTKKQQQELARLEKQILKTTRYVGGHGMFRPLNDWDKEKKDKLKGLLAQRCKLMNQMFECTPEDVDAFRQVNDRLNDLTKKMHAKALSLYQAILKQGYDPEFDDDITVEGTLRYVFNDESGSVVWTEEERRFEVFNAYGSDFAAMLDILYDLYEDGCDPECDFSQVSFSLSHKPEMPASEFGLDDFMDDGQSWNEAPLNLPEFKDICICHAVHNFCCRKSYSIPDLLRMNDFWIDIKITHQHFEDRAGKRWSHIEEDKEA